jgi:hypothetical protein
MLLITSGTVLPLVTVTVCAALVVLIGTLPNAIDGGATLTVGRLVVPVRVTVPETAGAPTFTRTRAVRLLLLLGVNVTLIVQNVPTAKPVPPIGQFWVRPNRAGFAPPRVMLVILKGAPPVLDTVTV